MKKWKKTKYGSGRGIYHIYAVGVNGRIVDQRITQLKYSAEKISEELKNKWVGCDVYAIHPTTYNILSDAWIE